MRNSLKKIFAVFMALAIAGGNAAFADSTAPVAENLELITYRNVSVGGKMNAKAPKGANIHFTITTEPVKGTLNVSPDGHFVYTPEENKKGRDYFGYKAVDENGNESQEATVVIRIQRKAPAIRYTDTQNLPCDYAACRLAETGLYTGIQIGDSFYFHPESTMERGEFTSLCHTLGGLESTPFVTSQVHEAVSIAEAAVILNELLHISAVSCLAADTEADLDKNTLQAVSNLYGCGILSDNALPLNEPMSRGEAAAMILRATEILDKR